MDHTYITYIQDEFKKFNDDIKSIKNEIEEYINRIYEENINLNYDIVEGNYDIVEADEDDFFACLDNNKVVFNLNFIDTQYECLFNTISRIYTGSSIISQILEYVIRILLNCLLVHESHHFYYKVYRYEEYLKLKDKDKHKHFRKDKQLEVLADNFMVDFMNDKGSLHHRIAKLSEKFNQMKNDNYTIDDRIDDIVNEIKNIYT